MKARRIYVDTSVFGGCKDAEFAEYSIRLFDSFRAGINIILLSSTTLDELLRAPEEIRALVDSIPAINIQQFVPDQEMLNLSDLYVREGIVTTKYATDSLHIANAVVTKADVLVSWNFRHIVNLNKIAAYNSINLREGYGSIDIRTPREVIDYEK